MKRLYFGVLVAVFTVGSASVIAKPARQDRRLQALIEWDTRLCTQAYEDKYLTYDAMIQRLVDYREGKIENDPMAGHSGLDDWYLAEIKQAEKECRRKVRWHYLGK